MSGVQFLSAAPTVKGIIMGELHIQKSKGFCEVMPFYILFRTHRWPSVIAALTKEDMDDLIMEYNRCNTDEVKKHLVGGEWVE